MAFGVQNLYFRPTFLGRVGMEKDENKFIGLNCLRWTFKKKNFNYNHLKNVYTDFNEC